MKTTSTKTFTVAMASMFLFSCEQINEQDIVEPMKVTQEEKLVGYNPTTCNLVQTFGSGELPRRVSTIEEDRAVMTVKAQRRGHNGQYLEEIEGLLLDPRDPATDLTNPFDAQMLGMFGGILTVPDETGTKANRAGGRVILDFSPVGSVTMKTMLFTDIAEEDAGSKVELYNASGQLLDQQEIPVKGKNESIFVSFDNIPGVVKAVVTFGAERQNVGSGSIARLQLCVDGQGRYDDVRYYGVHTLWLEYTGSHPANVTVTAKEGASDKQIFSAKGMKPGTMFKLASADRIMPLGEALDIETNRKEKQTIPVNSDRTASLQKQYGSFRVVEARCTDYPLRLE